EKCPAVDCMRHSDTACPVLRNRFTSGESVGGAVSSCQWVIEAIGPTHGRRRVGLPKQKLGVSGVGPSERHISESYRYGTSFERHGLDIGGPVDLDLHSATDSHLSFRVASEREHVFALVPFAKHAHAVALFI